MHRRETPPDGSTNDGKDERGDTCPTHHGDNPLETARNTGRKGFKVQEQITAPADILQVTLASLTLRNVFRNPLKQVPGQLPIEIC
jgi:hypothetical protein